MNNESRFYNPEDFFSQMMKKPEPSKNFGAGAWVYSEISARCMVIDAYEAGKKSALEDQ